MNLKRRMHFKVGKRAACGAHVPIGRLVTHIVHVSCTRCPHLKYPFPLELATSSPRR